MLFRGRPLTAHFRKNIFMRRFIIPLILLVSNFTSAQPPTAWQWDETVNGSHLSANISNNGQLFTKNGEGYFKIPFTGPDQPSPTTIRKAGLWIGGLDPGGNLKISAAAVDSESEESDFQPGPLDAETGMPYVSFPENYFNFIWKVTGEEIMAFLEDFHDNHALDNPVPAAIMNWPGNGNPYFQMWPGVAPGLPKTQQGWAPFYDSDLNGYYDPMKGDFPALEIGYGAFIPYEMTWTVFNDQTEHPVTNGIPTGLEVQQTAWTMDCDSYDFLEKTVFVDYTFINRAKEDLDSVFAGIWVDFDIGCAEDDYIGTLSENGAFFGYNMDNMDGDVFGDCGNGQLSYGVKPPVQSVVSLNYTNGLSAFTYYTDDPSFPSGMQAPTTDAGFYNYLTGRWRDGTPFTNGGTGYNPGSTNYTMHVFDGNPNDPEAWTEIGEQSIHGNKFAIGSHELINPLYGTISTMQPGGVRSWRVAFTYNRFPTYNHISILNRMIEQDFEFYYDALFSSFYSNQFCFKPNSGATEEEEESFKPTGLYPNPATNELHLSFPGTETEEYAIFNTAGQLLYAGDEKKGETYTIELPALPPGLYLLRLRIDGYYVTEKFVVGPHP